METIIESLKHYLENRTPEQIKKDNEMIEKYQNIGPTVEEYFQGLLEATDNEDIKKICISYLNKH